MSLLDRNYGAVSTAREFFQGNVGFVTVGFNVPANVVFPGMTEYNTAKAALKAAVFAAGGDSTAQATLAAYQLVVSTAERNLFKVAQALGQRAVVIAVSDSSVDTSSTLDAVSLTVGGNVLAGAKSGTTSNTGTSSLPNVYFTFIIERADVLTAQTSKPGSIYSISVTPAQDIVDQFNTAFFEQKTFQAAPDGTVITGAKVAATGSLIKVFDSLPVAK